MKIICATVTAAAAVLSVPINATPLEIEDEIIITATREPTRLRDVLPAAQVFTRADIDRIQPKDLGTLLGRASGVSFRDSGGRGSTSGVFIRGAAPSQSIILIDGIRSASASVGATAIESIPIESIERIEVVKGPLSGLYGADAIGGVIQIFTKKGEKKGLTPAFHVGYSTDDTQEYSAELSAGNERGGFHGTFSYENSQGIDRTTTRSGGNADRDGFDEFSLNLSAHYQLFDQLGAQLNILRTDSHNEFDNLFGQDSGFDSDGKTANNALKLTYTPSEKLRVSFDLGHFVDQLITPVFNSDITTRRTSAYLQSDYKVHENHTVTIGFDYYIDRIDALSNFTEDSRDNLGVFVQWQGRYGKFATVASVRYDDNETYGSNTNGSVVIEYKLLDSFSPYFSYGTAFRAPSFNDLFFPFFGNPDVQPEESETFEFGMRGQFNTVQWRASTYYTDVEDLIGFDPATFTAANTTEASLEGVELEARVTFADWYVNANINYLDARDDITNEYLDDRASFAANLEVYRQIGQYDFAVDLQAERGRHDSGGSSIDGYAILGASVNYRFNNKLRISTRLDNMFNTNYTLNLATGNDSFLTYGRTALISLHAKY